MSDRVVIGAWASAEEAVRALSRRDADRRAAVLPRAAAGDADRLLLRDTDVECLTTLEAGGLAEAGALARTLADAQGWALVTGVPAGPAAPEPGDIVGWYEVRIGARALTTDRPVTRLTGAQQFIASFNLLGEGRLNHACGEILHHRLVDEGIVPSEVFDVLVCPESKAVGMVQVLAECFGADRYVVLRKAVKSYMPRRPRAPLLEEVKSITTAGTQVLVLDPVDWPLVEGRRVLLVDDVIATGGSVLAASSLISRAGGRVVAVATVLLKGDPPDLPRFLCLARPLL